MANGLESKTVEAPHIDQDEQIRSQEIIDARERQGRLKAEEARKIQALQMTRARIREQLSRTSSERYTLLLNTELQQIDGELAKLA
jgi:superfamily I DNA/RNA helicase